MTAGFFAFSDMTLTLKQRFNRAVAAFHGDGFFTEGIFIGTSGSFPSETKAWKYIDFAAGGFQANPIVYRCIQEWMETVSTIKMVVQDGDELIKPETQGTARELQNLLDRPSTYQAQPEWLKRWTLYMGIGGIDYIQGNGLGFGVNTEGERMVRNSAPELQLIRPDLITAKHSHGIITEFKFDEKVTIDPEKIIFTLFPDPLDEFRGMPPMQPATESIQTSNLGQTWNKNIMKNEGRLSGVMSVDAPNMIDEKVKELQARFLKMYGGSENAGKTLFLSRLATYTSLAQSPKELDWTGSEGVLNRKICGVFRVPSQILGDPETSKFSNYKEARKALYQDVSLPLHSHLVEELNNWLIPDAFDDKTLKIVQDISHIEVLRDNENELFKRQLDAKDILTINERRKIIHHGDLDNGEGDVIAAPAPIGQFSVNDGLKDIRSGKHSDHEDAILEHIDSDSDHRTQESRDALVDKLDDDRKPFEEKWADEMRDFWKKQERIFLERLDNFKESFSLAETIGIYTHAIPPDLPADVFADFNQNAALAEFLKPLQFDIVSALGAGAMVGSGLVFDADNPALVEWLATDLAERSRLINKTTANQLRLLLTKATTEGVGFQETKLRIQEKFAEISKGRAVAIARTEVLRAQSQSTQEAFKQRGTKLNEWVSARDSLVRTQADGVVPGHDELDGEVVEVGQQFSNGATAPGLSGIANQDINCRCVLAPLNRPSEAI